MERVPSRDMRYRFAGAVMVVCVMSFEMIVGCGGRAADGTVAVTGTVLIDGGPLTLTDGARGGVNFQTQDGTHSGSAKIGVNGAYAARLHPGVYEVAVWAEATPVAGDSGQMPRAESLIAEKYRSTKSSDIQVEVPSTGGVLNIALER